MDAAVFLDRDNTLIVNDGDLGNPGQVRLREGVPDGLRALRDAGYRLIVVTNQGGVARGRFTEDDVDSVHQRIATLVDEATGSRSLINRFYYCPYHPDAPLDEYRRDHPWRKPNPGMLLQAARDLNLDLGQSWMVGDQGRDVLAGRAAGCRTILLADDDAAARSSDPTAVAVTFEDAVRTILAADGDAGNGREPAPVRRSAAPRAAARAERPRPDVEGLRRAITDLTELLRAQAERRSEFTGLRLAAGMCQLLALLLALLGLLQLGSTDLFLKWMIGAALVQMLTIAILIADGKT